MSLHSQRALFIYYASVASNPPMPGFQTVGQVRAWVLPAEILPLLRELNPAKRASQREHKFSIISPSWWPPQSLFSSSGRNWFLLPHSHLPLELVCWKLLKPRQIKIRSVEWELHSLFFPSFNVLFMTHDLKKALTYKPAVTTEVIDAAAAGSDALTDCSPFVFFLFFVFLTLPCL